MKNKTSPARKSDPHTSKAAAERQRPMSQKMLILESFAWKDSTDEEAAERATGVHPRSCWWKRCSDLRDEGLIEWVRDAEGQIVTKKGSMGVHVGISRVTNKGYKALAQS